MPRQITPEDCRQIRNRPDGRFFITFSLHDHDGVTIGLLGGEYRFQTFGDTLFPQSQSYRFCQSAMVGIGYVGYPYGRRVFAPIDETILILCRRQ